MRKLHPAEIKVIAAQQKRIREARQRLESSALVWAETVQVLTLGDPSLHVDLATSSIVRKR